jgi:hypothetical protein
MKKWTQWIGIAVSLLVVVCDSSISGDEPGLQEVSQHYTAPDQLPSNTILAITAVDADNGLLGIKTDTGTYVRTNGQWQAVTPEAPSYPTSILPALYEETWKNETILCGVQAKNSEEYIGTDKGLFRYTQDKGWQALYPIDEKGRSWAPRNVRGLALDNRGYLWFCSTQGGGMRNEDGWTLYTGEDGLPYNDFTCMATGGDGSVWFGTTKGAIRFDGQRWAYRQGKRWLPGDHVNHIAIAQNGDAWIATNSGVSCIKRIPMTLAEKADFYEQQIEQYIKRTEYGYTSEIHLEKPGDFSILHKSDSDNDGLWTSMYGAGECFAYAVTHDAKAKQRAQDAFKALLFLSEVCVDGEVNQQPGFVARTVVPTTEPDPNRHYTIERQRQRREQDDSLWKIIHPRWPKSHDGKYWYKIDTSSDELDGHYFFYPLYYDLVADTEAEKERVRAVVRAITDHLLRNNYCLVDHDGKPTRWAVFSPDILNLDPKWYVERGLNSLSMLSYLTVAEYLTGDPKYTNAINDLIENHSYAQNMLVPKIQRGLGSGNQSDDEMAVMNFYNLIRYTKNEELKRLARFSFFNYWVAEFPEMNPFFNFAYAACGLNQQFSLAWDTFDLSPWEGWLEDSLFTLRDFPLDRLNWSHSNSHRTDILTLPDENELEPPFDNSHRGYRVSGKVLPVSERHFNHWNTDPWRLDYGGGGNELASGTVYLLPYYMGKYHGFIE